MEYIYPILIAFCLIFFSELGDKTQILVLSFSSKSKTINIILGIALGTFFSHGLAILFGSQIAQFENETFHTILKLITYITFLLFGIIGFTSGDKNSKDENEPNFLRNLKNFTINYIFIVALRNNGSENLEIKLYLLPLDLV